jgi:hypothetical protein
VVVVCKTKHAPAHLVAILAAAAAAADAAPAVARMLILLAEVQEAKA